MRKLADRFAPAKLDDKSNANAVRIYTWLVQGGFSPIGSDPDKMVEFIYEKVCDNPAALVWEIKPKKLLLIESESEQKHQKAHPQLNAAAEEQLQARNKQIDATNARAKKQADGLRRCKELIESFVPTGPNGVNHALQAKVQATLRKYLEQEQAKGSDANDCANKIFAYIQKEYEADERARITREMSGLSKPRQVN